jgi:hypothetical protein
MHLNIFTKFHIPRTPAKPSHTHFCIVQSLTVICSLYLICNVPGFLIIPLPFCLSLCVTVVFFQPGLAQEPRLRLGLRGLRLSQCLGQAKGPSDSQLRLSSAKPGLVTETSSSKGAVLQESAPVLLYHLDTWLCTLYTSQLLIRVYVSVHPQQFVIIIIYQQVIPAPLRSFTIIITIFVILTILTDLRFKD